MGLCFIAVATVIYLIYRNRIQQIENKAALELQIQELRQSALRAQMNPHFIFNCLNSIQGYIAKGDSISATHYLAHFSRLIRIVLNTSIKQFIPLEEEIALLKHYMELENLRLTENFEYEINIDPKIDVFEVSIPPLLVQPLIENAIIHGLAKIKTKGRIEINYAIKENNLRIRVRDNGIGFTKQKQKNNQKSRAHESLGIGITLKRLQLQHDELLKNEPFEVQSLEGVKGWGRGTQVTILIPIER